MHAKLRWIGTAVLCLLLVAVAAAQSEVKERTLVINGQSGKAMIYEVNGRSFVDIATLARIANATLSFRGNEIVLTLHPEAGSASARTTAPQQPSNAVPPESAMSSNFMNAAIQDLALLKQWSSIMAYGITKGVPGDGSRLVVAHDKAAEGLRLANVAASTEGDRQAMQLLNNHFNNVNAWNDKLVNARKTMSSANYSMSEDALSQDPLYQKISTCAGFLNKMLPSGQFSDDGSCH